MDAVERVELSKPVELVDRIKQLRAERKRYFDVEGDGVDVLLCDIQDYFDGLSLARSNGWQDIETAPKDGNDIGKRLCEMHARVLNCFAGATGEPPPRRPRSFTPEWGDTETLLDAACALDRLRGSEDKLK